MSHDLSVMACLLRGKERTSSRTVQTLRSGISQLHWTLQKQAQIVSGLIMAGLSYRIRLLVQVKRIPLSDCIRVPEGLILQGTKSM